MAGNWVEVLDSSKLGQPNGVAQLDGSQKLSGSQIPSVPVGNLSGVLDASQIPNLAQSKITGLSTALASKVSNTVTVNGHALSGNISVTKGDVGLGNVENKSSATIRGEISKTNITNTGVNTADLIEKVTELPASGNDGEMVKFNDALYVWKAT
jgi:hypothetical protein